MDKCLILFLTTLSSVRHRNNINSLKPDPDKYMTSSLIKTVLLYVQNAKKQIQCKNTEKSLSHPSAFL